MGNCSMNYFGQLVVKQTVVVGDTVRESVLKVTLADEFSSSKMTSITLGLHCRCPLC